MSGAHASEVRALLRSGTLVEIGGRRPHREVAKLPLVLGFAAIYLIWGSTYLGIRYAVETIPPLLMMGIRHSAAGVSVYAWARWKGAPSPTARQWGYAVVAGALLFLGGHGSLAWAEQRVPSGLAALLCATLPLWTVLLGRVRGAERNLGTRAWAGLALGFVGVGLLIGPDALRNGRNLSLLALAAVLFSAFSWAVGTIYSRDARLPASTMLSAATQMMAGGAWLLLLGIVIEGSHVHPSGVTTRSLLSLMYLIVFGSIVAFTAFSWLLTVTTPSRVSTYAYVNPVVAVLIGWGLAKEPIGAQTIVATAIILAAVALVTTHRDSPGKILGRASEKRSCWSPQEIEEGHGLWSSD